jgi:hypothetical protein
VTSPAAAEPLITVRRSGIAAEPGAEAELADTMRPVINQLNNSRTAASCSFTSGTERGLYTHLAHQVIASARHHPGRLAQTIYERILGVWHGETAQMSSRQTKLRRLSGSLLAIALLGNSILPPGHLPRALASEVNMPTEAGASDGYPEADILEGATKEANKKLVISTVNAVLAEDLGKYHNPIYADFIKSLAYAIRARAKADLKFPLSEVLSDEMKAADLGELGDMRFVFHNLVDAAAGKNLDLGINVTPDLTEHYVRAAARLGDGYAAHLLATGKVGSTGDLTELIYWEICSVVNANIENDKRLEAFIMLFKSFGSDAINRALSKYSPAGGIIRSSDPRLPGRGKLTTIAMLRTMQVLLERRMPIFDHQRAERETPLSARDVLERNNKHFETASLGMRTYLLVPMSSGPDDRYIVRMAMKSLLANIVPGDGIFVRCGPLAHYAVVWKIDRARSRIFMHDDLFEFWMPSHNECISQFNFVSLKEGRYIVELSMDEVAPIIEAAETTRDHETESSVALEKNLEAEKGLIWNKQ